MYIRLSLAASVLAAGLVFSGCSQDVTEPVAVEGSAGSGNDTRCVGALTGTFDNVVVPRGATCTLTNSTVRGNVKALRDSRLFMDNDFVGGNVEGDQASAVQVVLSLVEGNIKITEQHDPIFISAFILLTDLPNGNIQIEKGRPPLGDFFVAASVLDKGNIQVVENSSDFTSLIQDNTVAQDVQVFKNTEPLMFVNFNEIGGNLQCKENVGVFVGQPNVVGGNAEDQCAGPGGMSASASASASASVAQAVLSGNFPVRKQGK
jgi:hypothetical protein